MKVKSLPTLTLMLFFSLTAFSQELIFGSFKYLTGQTKVDFVVDFSGGIYDNLEESDMAQSDSNKWIAGKKEVRLKLIGEANEQLSSIGLRLGTYDSSVAKYRLVFEVWKVDRDGKTTGNISLYPINGNEKLAVASINEDGGTFGSFINLMGDAFIRIGSSFGKYLRKRLD